jgi:hypothetical protein
VQAAVDRFRLALKCPIKAEAFQPSNAGEDIGIVGPQDYLCEAMKYESLKWADIYRDLFGVSDMPANGDALIRSEREMRRFRNIMKVAKKVS